MTYPAYDNTLHTTLPAPPFDRSPSPGYLSSMKDLVPAPLRSKTQSPIPRPRTTDGGRSVQPVQEIGPRGKWNAFPVQRLEGPDRSRSVSPMPSTRLPETLRIPTPPPKDPLRQRDYLTAEQVENLPSSQRAYQQPNRVHQPSTKTAKDAILSPRAVRSPVRPGPRTPGRLPRRQIPSMIDYLTMEQLEDIWQIQDQYKGTVDVPAKLASPVWLIQEDEDPRSPGIHPAFRNRPHPFHNSFASPA